MLSPCVTYRGRAQYDHVRQRARPIPEGHDTANLAAAFALASDPDVLYMGVYYRRPNSSYQERVEGLRLKARAAGAGSFESALARFRT